MIIDCHQGAIIRVRLAELVRGESPLMSWFLTFSSLQGLVKCIRVARDDTVRC